MSMFWSIVVSWYVGSFIMCFMFGVNRYKHFVANRGRAFFIILGVSILWPLVSFCGVAFVVIRTLAAIAWTTVTGMGGVMATTFDDAMRRGMK